MTSTDRSPTPHPTPKDNHFHRLVEAHTRTALLLPFIGYTRATPYGEAGFTREPAYAEEPLGMPGLADAGTTLGAADAVHGGLVHLLDAPITNWPDWQGMLALRERLRDVSGLPRVASVGYLQGGAAAAPMPLPWGMHHPGDPPTTPVAGAAPPAQLAPGCPSTYASGRLPRLVVHARSTSRYLRNHARLVPALAARVHANVSVLDDAQATTWPLGEQLRAFAAADVLVAPHGAGLANTIVMAPGAVLVEVAPEGWRAHFYMHMATALGLGYARVDAAGGKFDSLEAPIDRVVVAVCAALARAEAASPAAR